jgi:hypothetical protein
MSVYLMRVAGTQLVIFLAFLSASARNSIAGRCVPLCLEYSKPLLLLVYHISQERYSATSIAGHDFFHM